MLAPSGDWDWVWLSQVLPLDIVDRIASVLPPHAALGRDRPAWRWNDSREFSSSSTYMALISFNMVSVSGIWKCIWNLDITPQIQTFLWLTRHEHLMNNFECCRRHISMNNLCPICFHEEEDVNHVLQHCYRARQVWLQVLSGVQLQYFFNNSFEDWFDANIRNNVNHWNILFAMICWVL
ncbi:hypothetical protein V6N11_082306 [Hibiscus sabdariffa]|uniref:Reverse transcriptase zinc-binding domain-containing protein n=2 Tax=Hibiscus sabdariffa TaxID=183260 RepID=A0ABR1ZU94_9ROSI